MRKTKKCKQCKVTKNVSNFKPLGYGTSSVCLTCNPNQFDKTCVECNETKHESKFADKKRTCIKCANKKRRAEYRKKNPKKHIETIFEHEHKLKQKAVLSLDELKQKEKESIKKGAKWVKVVTAYGIHLALKK